MHVWYMVLNFFLIIYLEYIVYVRSNLDSDHYFKFIIMHVTFSKGGAVAQWVERWTCNQ